MKVLYDFQIFNNQNHGGISRYFIDLISGFEQDKIQFHLPLKYSKNEYLLDLKPFSISIEEQYDAFHHFLIPLNFIGKQKIFNFYSRFYTPHTSYSKNMHLSIKSIKESDFDLFHPTYYDPYFLNYLHKKPFILTVYDMIHELYPEYFGQDVTIQYKKKLIKKASRIIAISNNTKRDLCDLYKIHPEKVDVIYLSSSLGEYIPQSLKHSKDLNFPYLLYTGVRWGYKNFTTFIKAATPILQDYKDLKIICTGSPFEPSEIELFLKLGINDRLIHKSANNELLAALYRNAELFIFPSFYEGFGIPVLEAFACKCAVALSYSSSLIEVGGNAAIYFDPRDENSISGAILSVLKNSELKNELIMKGELQLNKFTKDKMINETIRSYQFALEKN